MGEVGTGAGPVFTVEVLQYGVCTCICMKNTTLNDKRLLAKNNQ
jgi:hypothetical protein